MRRVATCVIEVRDGRVTNYRGDYEAYLYAVNKEIDDGEREQAARLSKPPAGMPAITPSPEKQNTPTRAARRNEREVRKEITNVERAIARLDERKRQAIGQLMQSTDPAEALRLHNEVASLTTQLSEAEERWCQLQQELEAA
jgi:ATP-binding cassette subfamily F protein 3